ncbi:TPA: hypothetical protein OB850_002431 [Escherichia coli]|uniref:hypothetical protein n=1 Tax=Escherichia coli TaxID=562 RepID=UPI001255CB76|nr:hypothetical protein [Escherichia coli]EFI9520617.1 hypothetical protein [Escherichia coli]EIM6230888.1 hypothetical protein [Escherichia coli]MUM98985.1 hypothetical protein [Escherichia coli]QEP79078.1 hypothetical protein F1L19_07010 [Escherichia coli]HBB8701677.1 hypothetical protein [Escherichia coli]
MIYLQFPDEATAKSTTGWWSKSAGWASPTPELQIAVRGVLLNNDGEYDPDTGEMIKEPSRKDGFFIDVICGYIPTEAQQYIVIPNHPYFVLA